MVYETDKEKAELFASVLTDTFTDAGSSFDFDQNFHSYVEIINNYITILNYFDKNNFFHSLKKYLKYFEKYNKILKIWNSFTNF